jgi:hypothetical protein
MVDMPVRLPRPGCKLKPQQQSEVQEFIDKVVVGNNTALRHATHHGKARSAQLQLQLGAQLKWQTGTFLHHTPELLLEQAMEKGHTAVVQVLMEATKVGSWLQPQVLCSWSSRSRRGMQRASSSWSRGISCNRL